MIWSLNDQLINQRFGNASHKCILHMAKIGIYTVLPKYIPKLYLPCCSCIISKRTRFPHHTNLSTENLDPGTHFHIEFKFFKKVYCQEISSALTIVDTTTSHLFGYNTISKCTTIQHTMTFIQFYRHHGYNISIFRVDECGELMHWLWSYCWKQWRIWLFNKRTSKMSPPNHK